MNSEIFLLSLASLTFAVGGLCMKLSQGLTRIWFSAAVLVLFCAGAVMQALALRRTELASGYVFVLGGEAVATLLLSVCVLGERCPPARIGAVALVVIGMAWLQRT